MTVKTYRNRQFTRLDVYKVDAYNLRRLTEKITQHARPSYAATLHALLRLACQQHGIDPLEEDEPMAPQSTVDSTQRTFRQSQQKVRLREKRLLDIEGSTQLYLRPIL